MRSGTQNACAAQSCANCLVLRLTNRNTAGKAAFACCVPDHRNPGMKKILVGVAVALALVTSNAAADGIDKRPSYIAAPAPIYAPTWSGFYIGAGVGAGTVLHDVSVNDE